MKATQKAFTPAFALAAACLLAQVSTVQLPQDKGPDKIDVAAYPEAHQKTYGMFRQKCSKCHTIARPINTTMTRAEWERYVKRMMHKPNSEINESQGKTIFAFLIFDQTERKAKNPQAFFRALSDEEIEKLQQQQGQ
jgi:mono/diheme cytochrome c family protein